MIETGAAWIAEGGTSWLAALAALVGALWFLGTGVLLARADAREHRLPRRLVNPLYPVLGLTIAAAWLLAGEPAALLGGLLGALLTGGFYLAIRLVSPRSIGLGDVRLAPVLGWLTGTLSVPHVLAALFLTFLLAGLWAAGLVLTRRAGAASHVALGPWMLLATAVAWLLLPASLV